MNGMSLDVGLDIFESEMGFRDGGETGDPVGDGESGDEIRSGHWMCSRTAIITLKVPKMMKQ
jgi:hypothetical protein